MLETERLSLREFDVGDAPFIRRLLNEPAFLRFIGDRGVRTDDDARAYLERVPLESYLRLGYGLYLVELVADGTPIGMCGLMRKPWLNAPDLAYAFLSEYGGRGYALEAARAVLDHARVTLKLDHVVAVVQPDNVRSIRLLEKLRFTSEGTVTDPAGAELELHSNGGRTHLPPP